MTLWPAMLDMQVKFWTFIICSSCSHTWDAFQLAHASFRLYCVRNNYVLPSNSQKDIGKLGPCLLGDPPKIDVVLPEADPEEEEGSSETLPAIKIYDEDVNMRFLVCGVPCTLVSKIEFEVSVHKFVDA